MPGPKDKKRFGVDLSQTKYKALLAYTEDEILEQVKKYMPRSKKNTINAESMQRFFLDEKKELTEDEEKLSADSNIISVDIEAFQKAIKGVTAEIGARKFVVDQEKTINQSQKTVGDVLSAYKDKTNKAVDNDKNLDNDLRNLQQQLFEDSKKSKKDAKKYKIKTNEVKKEATKSTQQGENNLDNQIKQNIPVEQPKKEDDAALKAAEAARLEEEKKEREKTQKELEKNEWVLADEEQRKEYAAAIKASGYKMSSPFMGKMKGIAKRLHIIKNDEKDPEMEINAKINAIENTNLDDMKGLNEVDEVPEQKKDDKVENAPENMNSKNEQQKNKQQVEVQQKKEEPKQQEANKEVPKENKQEEEKKEKVEEKKGEKKEKVEEKKTEEVVIQENEKQEEKKTEAVVQENKQEEEKKEKVEEKKGEKKEKVEEKKTEEVVIQENEKQEEKKTEAVVQENKQEEEKKEKVEEKKGEKKEKVEEKKTEEVVIQENEKKEEKVENKKKEEKTTAAKTGAKTLDEALRNMEAYEEGLERQNALAGSVLDNSLLRNDSNISELDAEALNKGHEELQKLEEGVRYVPAKTDKLDVSLPDLVNKQRLLEEGRLSPEEKLKHYNNIIQMKDMDGDKFGKQLLNYRLKVAEEAGKEFDKEHKDPSKMTFLNKTANALEKLMCAMSRNPLGIMLLLVAAINAPMLMVGLLAFTAWKRKHPKPERVQAWKEENQRQIEQKRQELAHEYGCDPKLITDREATDRLKSEYVNKKSEEALATKMEEWSRKAVDSAAKDYVKAINKESKGKEKFSVKDLKEMTRKAHESGDGKQRLIATDRDNRLHQKVQAHESLKPTKSKGKSL